MQAASVALLAAATLLAAACGGPPSPAEQATAPAQAESPPPSRARQPSIAGGGVASGRAPAVPDRAPEARLDGFGALRLGMAASEAEAAWPGLLADTPGALQRRGCFHVDTGLPYFALMFDRGRFVRYGGSNDALVAPGGGRRGMREAQLRALYHDALAQAPDRFAAGGKLLSIDASGVAPSKLVFVLRPDGVVNEWRVGLHPQVDYDEGCESAG